MGGMDLVVHQGRVRSFSLYKFHKLNNKTVFESFFLRVFLSFLNEAMFKQYHHGDKSLILQCALYEQIGQKVLNRERKEIDQNCIRNLLKKRFEVRVINHQYYTVIQPKNEVSVQCPLMLLHHTNNYQRLIKTAFCHLIV